MARDPIKRAKSREADKIRKRLRRLEKKIQKDINKKSGYKSYEIDLKKTLNQVQKNIESLKYNRKTKSYSVQDFNSIQESLKQSYKNAATRKSAADIERINHMFIAKQKMANKTTSQKSNGSDYTAKQRQQLAENAFMYKMTKNLWETGNKADYETRNERILDALKNVKFEYSNNKYKYIETMEDVLEFLKKKYPDLYPTLEDQTNFDPNKRDNDNPYSVPGFILKSFVAMSASDWQSVGAIFMNED